MENLYVKLAAYREVGDRAFALCVRSLLMMHQLCLSMLLMRQLRAIPLQPIIVLKRRVIILPSFT